MSYFVAAVMFTLYDCEPGLCVRSWKLFLLSLKCWYLSCFLCCCFPCSVGIYF